MAEIHDLNANRSSTSQANLAPIMAHLSGCLALVRPVGMTEDETRQWLNVAARTLAEYSLPDIAAGCGTARRDCTHYSQIVPTVAKHCEAVKIPEPIKWEQPTIALPPPKLTQAEVDRIVADRGREMSIARDRGLILKTDDGRFIPA